MHWLGGGASVPPPKVDGFTEVDFLLLDSRRAWFGQEFEGLHPRLDTLSVCLEGESGLVGVVSAAWSALTRERKRRGGGGGYGERELERERERNTETTRECEREIHISRERARARESESDSEREKY
jgi:hypothetical protein